ncbi:MAG: tetratricopeptide repeat protein [Planctomycetes bacterium]|nr:tetratricopeptide repeat protein [Planctomycetota bacterium]
MIRMTFKLYKKLLTALIIFPIVVGSVGYGKDIKSKVVIFPFKNSVDSNLSSTPIGDAPIKGVEDVIRSELIRSGYFTIVEQERTFEFVRETVLNNFFKVDNVDVKTAVSEANIVDLFAGVDLKMVVRVSERLKADFAVKGAINQFGDNFRADIEVVNVKLKETVSALVGECESKEKISEMLEQLSQQIVNVCKGVNVQSEVDHIQSSYQQGKLTYEETVGRLKKLSSGMPGVFTIHCALFSNYLGHPEMGDNLIEEGEEILNLFDADNEEDMRYLASLGIDPFYELANVYVVMGKLDRAIEIYRRAIRVYPMNHAKYFKQLGVLYKLEDETEASIDAFKQVLNMNPADCEARYNLASVYEAKGDMFNALEQYQASLKYTQNAAESSRVKEKIKQLQSKEGIKAK